MKAIVYNEIQGIEEFEMSLIETEIPGIGKNDVLVEIKAFAVNPVDLKIRSRRLPESTRGVILGFDASGVISQIGENVTRFNVGDDVFYSGEMNRDGCYAEFQAVAEDIIAKKPKNLSYSQAAALPLASLTGFEAVIENKNYVNDHKILVIGGAGGVGSMAIQLLNKKTNAQIYTTASSEKSKNWIESLGITNILDHSKLKEEIQKNDIGEFDTIFITNKTDHYYELLPKIIKPYGDIILIDDPTQFDLKPFKQKAVNVKFEFMMAKTLFNYNRYTQAEILDEVSKLVDENKIKSTITTELKGFSLENLKEAFKLLTSDHNQGKAVISLS